MQCLDIWNKLINALVPLARGTLPFEKVGDACPLD